MDSDDTTPAGGTGESDRVFEREIVGLLDNLYGAALPSPGTAPTPRTWSPRPWPAPGVAFRRTERPGLFPRLDLFRILTNTFLTECRRHARPRRWRK